MMLRKWLCLSVLFLLLFTGQVIVAAESPSLVEWNTQTKAIFDRLKGMIDVQHEYIEFVRIKLEAMFDPYIDIPEEQLVQDIKDMELKMYLHMQELELQFMTLRLPKFIESSFNLTNEPPTRQYRFFGQFYKKLLEYYIEVVRLQDKHIAYISKHIKLFFDPSSTLTEWNITEDIGAELVGLNDKLKNLFNQIKIQEERVIGACKELDL